MAKRRTPPRYKSGPKKGQFKPKAARKRSTRKRKRRARRNPGRTVARRTRSNPRRKRRTTTRRRRTYRRNPRRFDVVRNLTDGVVEAGQVLIGKAAARSIPSLARLPQEGNMGLAVQAGTALVIGYVAGMFVGADAARAMTAGALTAPLETLIVANRVPWLSDALSPVSAQASVGRYVRGGGGVGRYVRRTPARAALPERGMGRYAQRRGMSYGYEG